MTTHYHVRSGSIYVAHPEIVTPYRSTAFLEFIHQAHFLYDHLDVPIQNYSDQTISFIDGSWVHWFECDDPTHTEDLLAKSRVENISYNEKLITEPWRLIRWTSSV